MRIAQKKSGIVNNSLDRMLNLNLSISSSAAGGPFEKALK